MHPTECPLVNLSRLDSISHKSLLVIPTFSRLVSLPQSTLFHLSKLFLGLFQLHSVCYRLIPWRCPTVNWARYYAPVVYR